MNPQAHAVQARAGSAGARSKHEEFPCPAVTSHREKPAVLSAATNGRGLLIGKGGLHGDVLRISPPAGVGAAEVDEAMAKLDEGVAAIEA
jgi:4-aminobutyrate aminotransferase